MAHYANVVNGLVVNVIVADDDFVNAHLVGNTDGIWIQASYNTINNIRVHGEGSPLRGNFPGVGYIYDETHDVFYPSKPYESWILDETTWSWVPPTEYPQDGLGIYEWNEDKLTWVLLDDNLS